VAVSGPSNASSIGGGLTTNPGSRPRRRSSTEPGARSRVISSAAADNASSKVSRIADSSDLVSRSASARVSSPAAAAATANSRRRLSTCCASSTTPCWHHSGTNASHKGPSWHYGIRDGCSASVRRRGGISRISLHLPGPLKLHIEQAVRRERICVSAWLIRAVAAALALDNHDRRSGLRSAPGDATTAGCGAWLFIRYFDAVNGVYPSRFNSGCRGFGTKSGVSECLCWSGSGFRVPVSVDSETLGRRSALDHLGSPIM